MSLNPILFHFPFLFLLPECLSDKAVPKPSTTSNKNQHTSHKRQGTGIGKAGNPTVSNTENDSEKDCSVQPEGYILYHYLIKIIKRSNN